MKSLVVPPFWSGPEYLKYYWMDCHGSLHGRMNPDDFSNLLLLMLMNEICQLLNCHEICYAHLYSPQDEL